MKQNCWEMMKCGREPGGANTRQYGVCPASVEKKVDGINGGKNGGRTCWAIAGTFCNGKLEGSFALKLKDCLFCDFYKTVRKEEGRNYTPSKAILAALE